MAKRSGPKEEQKVWGNVFDQFTQRTVYKLITQGHFEGLESPISIGKESNLNKKPIPFKDGPPKNIEA